MSDAVAIRVVAGVFEGVEPGHVLAYRRTPGTRHGGLWEFPGGKVEDGESDRKALARELYEELGVRARVGKRLWAGQSPTVPPLRIIFYEVSVVEGEPELREHDAVKSVPVESKALPWAPIDGAFVKWLARRRAIAGIIR
jgi:8-oxo-dGTP diphosphatase